VPAVEADRAGGRAVHAVGADQCVRAHARTVDGQAPVTRDRVDPRPVAEERARLGGTLGQVGIQPAPLRHQDQRRGAPALEPLLVAEAP
jgi:hypothetical protein